MKIGTKVYGETNLIFSLFMGSGETNVQNLNNNPNNWHPYMICRPYCRR